MSPTQAFSLVLAFILFLVVAVPVAVFVWKLQMEKRAARRAINEHTDDFWRQVG